MLVESALKQDTLVRKRRWALPQNKNTDDIGSKVPAGHTGHRTYDEFVKQSEEIKRDIDLHFA